MDGRRRFPILVVALAVLAACSSARAEERGSRHQRASKPAVPVAATAPAAPTTRILLVGDQVMQAAGPLVRSALEGTGRAAVTVDAEAGTGLASSDDWVARVQRDLDASGASIAVVQFGGVDHAPFAVAPDGSAAVPGSGPWYDRWSRQQRSLAELLRARHVSTYWLSTPGAVDPALVDRVEMVDLMAESLYRAFPDSIAHLDVRDRFVGPDGHFAATREESGAVAVLRTGDGYGLGPDGARIVADAITARIEQQWCLTGDAACHVAFTSVPAIATDRPASPRVLLVGDSMMWQLAPAIEARLAAAGIAARADVRSTTSPVGPFDWQGRFRGLVDAYRPDVVVGLFLGDLAPGYVDDQGDPVTIDSQHHYDLLGAAINEATTHLRSRGAHVLWVIGPRAAQPATEQRLEVLEALYEGVVDRSGGAVTVVDGFAALAGADGGYAFSLPDASGRPVPMRLPDGLHLSAAGVDRLAGVIVAAVRHDGCVTSRTGCDRG
ncbi:MAG: hypothetical protein U0V73_12200 [Acidimicrobiia bacterium]